MLEVKMYLPLNLTVFDALTKIDKRKILFCFHRKMLYISLDYRKRILLLNIITIGLDTNYNNLQGSSPYV